MATSTTSGPDDCLVLNVHGIAGKTFVVNTTSSEATIEVLAQVEDLLRIPAKSQRWLFGENELDVAACQTMADIGIASGSSITVVHAGTPDIPQLPNIFSLTLKSPRTSRIRSRYSSGFTVIYEMKGHVEDQWLYMEPWRKNDHDRLLYDSKSDQIIAETSHWMSGSSLSHRPLCGKDVIGDFHRGWQNSGQWVKSPGDRFWLENGSPGHNEAESSMPVPTFDKGRRKEEVIPEKPNYLAVPGWFVCPTDKIYHELDVHIPLPDQTAIKRLLVDESGKPLRAAIVNKSDRTSPTAERIEEYDVELEALGSCQKPLQHAEGEAAATPSP